MDPQEQRDELFERAKVGKITGEEADAEAIRLGLGSLSRRPAADAFRPESEAHWALPMAVAWIAYLDLHEVREWSAAYRAECYEWQWQRWRRGLDGPIYEGWHLDQRRTPSLSLLSLSAAFDKAEGDKPFATTVSEAREALWSALREGFFVSTGIDTESGRRVEIPALDWHELVAVQGKGDADEVRRGPMGTGYRDVLVPSLAVRGFWQKRVEKEVRLPPTIPPDGDGFMPLYCAAQWIATEGGAQDFPPTDPERWRAAFSVLLAAITSEKVRVVGLKGGEREVIGGHVFAGIQIDYPFEEAEVGLMLGPELYLRSYAYLDEEHWRGGFDDALIQRGHNKWTRLMVDKAAVRLLWPFAADKEEADQRTGFSGRPAKARNLIEAEMRLRAAEGRLAPSLTQEVDELLAWLKQAYPDIPHPKSGTVENNLRAEYRRAKKP